MDLEIAPKNVNNTRLMLMRLSGRGMKRSGIGGGSIRPQGASVR
ncbi:hypothetical protein [Streptomyces fuscichromogenes]|nr:hypothetical protein [Streptomyces fuscichromogenes]